MASFPFRPWLLLFALILFHASPAAAFGAGNIASISKLEGKNWRHGDIEDMLKTIAFIKGHKWTSMMIKRVYFGNWLRDYSQAVDVGTLKGIQSGTIRILVWVLSFLSFGYATGEFEVTEERLGVYRPEEHIDNPKDYADNQDARKYDERLRPPVLPMELQIDPQTGMKNYIANENLGIATSSGYVKHSFSRSIHFGRVYTSGASGTKGKESDLCEALRCLGQGLHCLEDFGAHTNYTELTLRELGFTGVFPHTGLATEINLQGHQVFPLVTGTFGAVDFLHSVLGEATDHFAQSEVEQMDLALQDAQAQSKPSDSAQRGFGESRQLSNMTGLLSQIPGAGGLCQQAEHLQAQSDAQEQSIAGNRDPQDPSAMGGNPSYSQQLPGFPPGPPSENLGTSFAPPPGTVGGPPGPGIPGMNVNFDPIKTAAQIYPILEFRDKVVRAISATIEKIPGLEALAEKISEKLTIFVLSLLAPFIRPIINAVSAQLKAGSSTVVNASGDHQYEPWTDPHCTDPTHSLLSKDHFSNILNEPAGQVASAILQYVAPRVLYAWEHPDIPVDQVFNDVMRVFHHPVTRDPRCEVHKTMFDVVEHWARSQPNGGANLNHVLGSESVKTGKNHAGGADGDHSHGGLSSAGDFHGPGSDSKTSGAPWVTREVTGVAHEGLGSDSTADSIPGAYPGTNSAFHSQRPLSRYSTQSRQEQYQQDPYARPSSQQQQPYDQASVAPWQQSQYPIHGVSGDAQVPYGYNPSASTSAPPQGGYRGGES